MAISLRGGSNYPYAVARVQAKRSQLIPASDYEKILKMDVSEITRTIEESVYKTEVDELASKFSGLDLLEAALTVNAERTFDAVRRMVSGEGGELVTLFLDRHHFEDIKTLLRGKLAGATRDELLREMVLESPAALAMFAPALAEDVKSIPDIIAAFERQGATGREWAAILARVSPGSPLSHYEDALDKAYYARLLSRLEGSKQKGALDMLEFIRREVDVRNLLNAARWVASGETEDFSGYVIPGGKHIPIAAVMSMSRSKDLDALAEQLADLKGYSSVREELQKARESKRLGTFQQAVWRVHLADLDRLAHGHPLSLIPILSFLLRKQREVITLRAVARGKAAGLSEARLRELIA
jgi:V/A-type H+-transporting ATPase subunit C